MIKKMGEFFQGRIVIAAVGRALAPFINECIREGIVFYKMQKSQNSLRAQIKIKDFFRLRRPARITRTRIRIVAKYGWPFIAARWWRRKTLLGGIAAVAIILIILSQMTLSISVSGNKNITKEELFVAAERYGLKTWTWQNSVDLNSVSKSLVEEFPDAAWIGISRKGTRVEIKVVEKTRPQVPGEAGNLIASKAGLVEKIMVIQGTSLVHEGEIVRPGQVLILAPETIENPGAIPKAEVQQKKKDYIPDLEPAAKGFVRGRVWYSGEATVPLAEEIVEETGQVAKGWGIKINSRVIMVTIPESPYSLTQEEVDHRGLTLWRNWRLPVELVTVNYKELHKVQIERTELEARQEAEKSARQEAYQDIPQGANIIQERVRLLQSGEGERVRLEVETYEDLAVYPDG